MAIKLREPTDSDEWVDIWLFANTVRPWNVVGHENWMIDRQGFDGRRSHYIAEDTETGEMVGYGYAEEDQHDKQDGHFLMEMVMSRENLTGGLGDLICDRILRDLRRLNARSVYALEHIMDDDMRAFFGARGFNETEFYVGIGAPDLVKMVLTLA